MSAQMLAASSKDIEASGTAHWGGGERDKGTLGGQGRGQDNGGSEVSIWGIRREDQGAGSKEGSGVMGLPYKEAHRLVVVRVHGWSIRGLERAISSSWLGYMGWRIGEAHKLVMVRVHGWSIRGLERAISSSWLRYMGWRIGKARAHRLVMV